MATRQESNKAAIECKGIYKRFGTVIANEGVDLSVQYGEILAILGENGSGKTTLMNMISGIYHPDEGKIALSGEDVTINSPLDAANYGIGMIHQHFKLVEVFTAMENIVLGTNEKLPKKNILRKEIQDISEKFGLVIDPDKKVYNMSVGEKQTVEILKVLYRGAKILILDEPTAVLTPQEIEKLFVILRKMKEEGKAIIIITHKLNEVLSISDRVTILRKGKSIDTVNTNECDAKLLTELMVGHAVSLKIDRPIVKEKKTTLKVVDLSIEKPDKTHGVLDLNFSLKSGEILGVAGVSGSGQKELCEGIAGLLPVQKGAILYKKENIVGKTPDEIIKLGISMSFVPEDRLGMGLVASMGIVDNVLLKSYKATKGPFVKKTESRLLAKKLVEKLSIVTPNVHVPVRLLSGGNVQKVLLGREIESAPNVLITAYPVRGLDINSSMTIYNLLNEQKQKGVAILFVGEDLDVLLEIADRIMVLCHGEITGIVDARSVTKEEIGAMMTGMRKGGDNEENT